MVLQGLIQKIKKWGKRKFSDPDFPLLLGSDNSEMFCLIIPTSFPEKTDCQQCKKTSFNAQFRNVSIFLPQVVAGMGGGGGSKNF